MAAPHLSDIDQIDRLKRAARQRARAARRGWDPALGEALGDTLLAAVTLPAGAVVAGFLPLEGEIDLRPLLGRLREAGHPIALPQTPAPGNPLIFRQWLPHSVLRPERFGTLVPDGPVVVPDVLLVPLLGFDRRGWRLGYGGGYYDRTLAALPQALAIGCGFAVQELDEVPVGPYDARLPLIATEQEVIACR